MAQQAYPHLDVIQAALDDGGVDWIDATQVAYCQDNIPRTASVTVSFQSALYFQVLSDAIGVSVSDLLSLALNDLVEHSMKSRGAK